MKIQQQKEFQLYKAKTKGSVNKGTAKRKK